MQKYLKKREANVNSKKIVLNRENRRALFLFVGIFFMVIQKNALRFRSHEETNGGTKHMTSNARYKSCRHNGSE